MRVGPTPVGDALRRLDEFGSGAAINRRPEVAFLIARAHLVAMLAPRRLKLVAAFTPRGGISTSVTVVHDVEGLPSNVQR